MSILLMSTQQVVDNQSLQKQTRKRKQRKVVGATERRQRSRFKQTRASLSLCPEITAEMYAAKFPRRANFELTMYIHEQAPKTGDRERANKRREKNALGKKGSGTPDQEI